MPFETGSYHPLFSFVACTNGIGTTADLFYTAYFQYFFHSASLYPTEPQCFGHFCTYSLISEFLTRFDIVERLLSSCPRSSNSLLGHLLYDACVLQKAQTTCSFDRNFIDRRFLGSFSKMHVYSGTMFFHDRSYVTIPLNDIFVRLLLSLQRNAGIARSRRSYFCVLLQRFDNHTLLACHHLMPLIVNSLQDMGINGALSSVLRASYRQIQLVLALRYAARRICTEPG